MTKKVAPDHPWIGLLAAHVTLAAEVGLAAAIERGLVSREDALRHLRRLERLAPPERIGRLKMIETSERDICSGPKLSVMAEEAERDDQDQVEHVEEEEPEVDAATDRAAKPKVGRAKSRGIPKGSAVPKDSSRKSKILSRFGKVGEPISPAETTRALYATHVAIAGILNSSAFDDVTPTRRGGQLDERDFQFYGGALSDVINHMLPEARIALRLVAPLTCVGEEIRIFRRIVEEVPEDAWWRRARARARHGQEQEAGWQPYVLSDLEQAS